MSRNSSSQIFQYKFKFESLLDCSESRECFKDFVATNGDKKYFEILADIDQYIRYIGTNSRYDSASKLINTRLRTDSFKSLHNGESMLKMVESDYASCCAQNCPRTLFDKVKNEIHQILKDKYYLSFVSSKQFEKHVKTVLKKDKNYLDTIGEKRPDITTTPEYDPTLQGIPYDIEKVEITDQDFDILLKDLKDDKSWVLDSKAHKASLYVSEKSFFHKGMTAKKTKEVYKFKFPVNIVLGALLSNFDSSVRPDVFLERNHLLNLEDGKYKGIVSSSLIKMPFPYQNRDCLFITCARRCRTGGVFVMKKSVSMPEHPESANYTRSYLYSGMMLERTGEDDTKMTRTSFFDPRFRLGKTKNLFSKVAEEGFVSQVEEACYEWTLCPDKSYPVYNFMLSNELIE